MNLSIGLGGANTSWSSSCRHPRIRELGDLPQAIFGRFIFVWLFLILTPAVLFQYLFPSLELDLLEVVTEQKLPLNKGRRQPAGCQTLCNAVRV